MSERAIGEIFQSDKVFLKVVEGTNFKRCRWCYFHNSKSGCIRNLAHVGNCIGTFRSDGTDIYFQQVL